MTVTVVAPALSATLSGFAVRVRAVGAASSSVIVISSSVTVRPAEVPETWIVSFPSTSASLAGVSVKLPVPLASPAAIVIVKFDTAV